MRILFLNSVFPGRFRSIAQAFGANPKNTVLFLAEQGKSWPSPVCGGCGWPRQFRMKGTTRQKKRA